MMVACEWNVVLTITVGQGGATRSRCTSWKTLTWKKAGLGLYDHLCVNCLVVQLGRPLKKRELIHSLQPAPRMGGTPSDDHFDPARWFPMRECLTRTRSYPRRGSRRIGTSGLRTERPRRSRGKPCIRAQKPTEL